MYIIISLLTSAQVTQSRLGWTQKDPESVPPQFPTFLQLALIESIAETEAAFPSAVSQVLSNISAIS
jgi:hypothetical protein